MASAGKGTTKQTTKPIKSKSSRATPTKLPGKNPARAIPTAPARKNQVKRISAGTNSTQKIRSASGIKLDNNNVKSTSPSTRREENIQETCVGWCMQLIQDSLEKTNISMINFGNIKENPEQEKRFAKIRSAVKSDPYYLVRVGANLYADKNEYDDRTINKLRAQMFHKNVLRVASDVFYPYTRNAIKNEVANSGYLYDPNMQGRSRSDLSQKSEDNFSKLLWYQKYFSNRYFQSNPGLIEELSQNTGSRLGDTNFYKDYYNEPKTKLRSVANERSGKTIDLFEGEKDMYDNSRMLLRSAKIDNFLYGKMKTRKTHSRSSTELHDMLGVQNEESIIEHPNNEVNDIIIGMKPKANSTSTIVMGTTAEARQNINKWLGKLSRSEIPRDSKDVGIILEGKSRNIAIDKLLRSMTTNYQYQVKQIRYKKLSGLAFDEKVVNN